MGAADEKNTDPPASGGGNQRPIVFVVGWQFFGALAPDAKIMSAFEIAAFVQATRHGNERSSA
jgi:hypothetical protein